MKYALSTFAAVALAASAASAAPITYAPTNPTFGGNPLNGSYLLTIANAQQQSKKNAASASAFNSTNNFAQRITDSVLARVSTEIADQIYGEDAADSGTYIIGDSVIDFYTDINTGNIVLNVDDGHGGITTVQIPKPTI